MESREQDGRDELIDRLSTALRRRPEIVFAYVHGSFIDGGRYRDIDVAVYLDPEKAAVLDGFDYAFKAAVDMSKQLRREVDIRVMNGSSTGFQNSVYRTGRLLFSRDERLRLDLLERNSQEAMDFHELSLEYLRECVGP
ncbi:MAG: nucleotidyltransferase domain-containing protein [Candidatus Aminicenantes bacterium]|nr:nucleotidyltransferase domain-containing protein [Candidatus Aminicenantes bacterium]